MAWKRQLRVWSLAPSVLIGALLLSACETTPRPQAPIYTGQPRMEPEPMQPDGETDPNDVQTDGTDPNDANADEGPTFELVIPPHMADREIRRAAVLLPFSHSNRGVREEAQSIFAAIEMALFEHAGDSILLLPKDTAGDPQTAGEVATEAIGEGAEIIIGPLFADNVRSVSSVARSAAVPLIAFSNDRSVAGGGAYLLSMPPEEEVERVVDWAVLRGVTSFAMLGPETTYGRRIETALRFEAARRGATVIASEFYSPSNDAPVDEAKVVADRLKAELQFSTAPLAVLIPEQGVKLRSVAPLLPYYGVDLRRVQLLGTGLWNDPTVWREPTLHGGVFAGADPEDMDRFKQAFEANYQRRPSELASFGYDAGALAIRLLSADTTVSTRELQNPDGFLGANGLFRFRLDGTIDRGLAVIEITPDGGVVLADPGAKSFSPGGS